MNEQSQITIKRTSYDRADCAISIVHLGFGAFHRAHQAVYFDDYMERTGDLSWGIAAVNLRKEEAEDFELHKEANHGYLLKTTSPSGESSFREVRSHVHFSDWSANASAAEDLLSRASVKVVSMTVTESGYYLNDDWSLNADHPVIRSEIKGTEAASIYMYLAKALARRMESINAPITVLCCDNIRSNGDVLGRNFKNYLNLIGKPEIADWVEKNATFPNSMVDRITPRATDVLRTEIAALSPSHSATAIHGESFSQWVVKNDFASAFPALDQVGVEIVDDVNPYEEAKIRVLNGGHTAVCYLGALAGHRTFDEAMSNPVLRAHFDGYETENVLPGLTLPLPFSKADYRDLIAERFSNSAIADDLGRICMDGWSKFPIFIRPTLKSCLAQGIRPTWGYDSIASWYVYARRFANGLTHIAYVEPYWTDLEPYLAYGQEMGFAKLEALWSDLPKSHEEFVPELCSAIKRMEDRWPT
jgi:D-arabinitol 4-dehydrogenase